MARAYYRISRIRSRTKSKVSPKNSMYFIFIEIVYTHKKTMFSNQIHVILKVRLCDL